MQNEKLELENIRREYLQKSLDEKDLKKSPFDMFDSWLLDAQKAKLTDPTAFVLATSNKENIPSQRIVLLKHFDQKGAVFYTNLESKKAKEIEQNQNVSMLFPWHILDRQVIIQVIAKKLSKTQNLKYFLSRPKESQIAATASKQSKTIKSRAFLENEFFRIKEKFKNKELPLPSFWGGYLLIPYSFEFFQGRANRLHDRFLYTKKDQEFSVLRLSP